MGLAVGVGVGVPFGGGALERWTPSKLVSCVAYFDSALGITLNGSDVAAWADQSGNAHHATQGTAAEQPGYSATGGPGGRPALVFDADHLNLALAGAFGAGTTYCIVAGINILTVPNPWGQGGAIFDCEPGAGWAAFCTDVNVAEHGMLTGGGWQATGAAPVTGEQTIVHAADTASSTGTVWRNGALLGTHTYSPRALVAPEIGSENMVAWKFPANMRLWKFALLNAVPTAGELALLHAWAAA